MPSFLSARRAFCTSLIAAATVLFLSASAQGQANPQLLPYTTTVLAGGGPTATYAAGGVCPLSGLTMTDKYGDGCRATELVLNGPRYVTQDKNGNYFFSDSLNFAIRRIDGATGIVTLVVGGAAAKLPTTPATCPSGGPATNLTPYGDGCPGTDAYLGKTAGLAIHPITGDLYFGDVGSGMVHKIAAGTGGVITTTGTMSLVAGNANGTFGYAVGDNANNIHVVAATQSYLDFPSGIHFDAIGNLFIGEEFKNAIAVVNTTSATTTVAGIPIPSGEIMKIMGAATSGPLCPNSPASTNGCNFGHWTDGSVGTSSQLDAPYDVIVDSLGNIYFVNEFNPAVGKIATGTDIITTYAGTQALGVQSNTKRATVGGSGVPTIFGFGSDFGLAIDPLNNLYVSDASNKVIWRIDAGTLSMYAVGGGATTVCAGATDTYGDGCPALQAKFNGSAGTFASTTAPGPGIYGIYVDSTGNLLAADTINSLIRKLASGTAFGAVIGHPTQTLDIHFGAGDTPAASAATAYVLTAGSSNFSIGVQTCVVNSDTTTDCTLPITVTATANGPFTGTLTVTSAAGKTASFPLTGSIVVPVASTTATTVAGTCPPGGSSTINVTVGNSVGLPSGGTVTIYVNGTAISTQTLPVTRKVTAAFAFPQSSTPYTVYATYGGDANNLASTTATQTAATFYSSPFTLSEGSQMRATVVAGATALYSVNVTAFTAGAYQFYCTGLPSGASCTFYPPPPVSLGSVCQSTATVALSVTTTPAGPVIYGFGGNGKGKWAVLGTLPAILLAMFVMIRRRKSPLRYSGALMALALLVAMAGTLGCGKDFGPTTPGTPAGTYSFSVTGVDAGGNTQTLPGFALVVTH